jgi:hypothetical protein
MEKITINKCCAICNNIDTKMCPLYSLNGRTSSNIFKICCSEFDVHDDLEDECEPENIEIIPKEPTTLPETSPLPSAPLPSAPWPESPYVPYPNPIIYPQVWYTTTNGWPLITWPKPEEPNTVSVTGTTNDIVYTPKTNAK